MVRVSSREYMIRAIFSLTMFLAIFDTGVVAAGQLCNSNIVSSTPYGNFDLTHSGLVISKRNNLMWRRCGEGQDWSSASGCSGGESVFTWQQALQYTADLNQSGGVSGFDDWRVPNINELSSIVEQSCFHPAFNMGVFPGVSEAWGFWSSSPAVFGSTGKAWFLHASSGKAMLADVFRSGKLILVRDVAR